MKTLLKHEDSLQMSKDKKSWLNRVALQLVVMGVFLLPAENAFASHLEEVKKDLARFIQAVHTNPTLAEGYYLYGEAESPDWEYVNRLCRMLGIDPNGERRMKYRACRWDNSAHVISYFLTALSTVVPQDLLDSINTLTIENGPEGFVPHEMVHIRHAGHTYSFYRSTEEHEFRVFGKISLSMINGKKIKLPDIDLMEVFNSDPCRDVLLKKQ